MVSIKAVDTTQLRVDGERMLADFSALAQIGLVEGGGISRPALSLADMEARAWFADRIEEAGFYVQDDDAGNLSGVMFTKDRDAKTFIIGSHLDTVPNGGRYDGTIGVLAGLEIARTIKDAGIELPFHLEVMNFTDEEGTWLSLLGSRGVSAQLPLTRLTDVQGGEGAFRAALTRAGIELDRVHQARRNPETVCGYLEMHIEQGGTLEREQRQIGVVSSIVGRVTTQITFRGQRGHSGTTDPTNRQDALQGAALFVTRAHQLVQDRNDGTVINCGQLEVHPGAFNVIPERATLLVECRHTDGKQLQDVDRELVKLAKVCGDTYSLQVESKQVEVMQAAKMHPRLIALLEESVQGLGLSYMSMPSYAGHDAQPMSRFTDTAMIFVPSIGATSHNPNEYSHWPDVVNGANVLLQTVLKIAARA